MGRPVHDGTVTSWPLTTVTLLFAIVLMFGVEVRVAAPAAGDAPTPVTQLLLGGLSGTLFSAGQWHRLLFHAVLHASMKHLVGNAVALWLAGQALERIVGHAWTLCIFVGGAACGGLAALLTVPPSTVVVGASGAIMAMLGALFMTSFRIPAGRARLRVQARAMMFGIPSLVPHHDPGPAHVSYAAHTGGAALGIAVGLLILKGWDDRTARPPCLAGAVLMSAMAVMAFGCCAHAVSIEYGLYGPADRFIPSDRIPTRPADIAARGRGLAASFPLDARSHVYAGVADLVSKDAAGAEGEFSRALELDAAAPGFYPPPLMGDVHLFMAVLLFDDGRHEDAVAMARFFCRQPDRAFPSPKMAQVAFADGLCG